MQDFSSSVIGVFGLPVDNVSMGQAVERIEQLILSGETHQVATANLDFVRNARRSRKLHQVICDCSMVLADGAPMLWASRLLGLPLKERVTGVDLVPELARLSARKGYRIFLLGSSDATAAAAMAALEMRFPGVQFAGQYSPEVAALEDMDNAEMLRRIHEAKPDILLVAFGNPKQELWLARNRGALHVPVSIGIGGALEMIAGVVHRAPVWIQKLQMEWVFRMLQEPQRLLPRYARDFSALLRYLPAECISHLRQPRSANNLPVQVTERKGLSILSTPVTLTRGGCSWLMRQARLAAAKGNTVVINMGRTERIEADGVGCLLQLRRMNGEAGPLLQVAGVSEPVYRVFENTALVTMFEISMAPSRASVATAYHATTPAVSKAA